MKRIAIAGIVLAMAIATLGFAGPWRSSDPGMAAQNEAFVWARASGPNGERDPATLPMYEAIIEHDEPGVARLLSRGASPNSLLYDGGWSPLMVAAVFNDRDSIALLLKHGADINYVSKDADGGNALGVALTYGIPESDLSLFHYLLTAAPM